MILPACPNGKCHCWCGFLAGEPQDFGCREMPSRIADLAASNDAPLDLDKQLCRSTLHDMQEDLQILDSHIKGLKRAISALKAMRKKKSKLACSYRSRILNPIRSLPNDILSKIFDDACPSVDLTAKYREYSSLNTGEAPWTLAKVSRRWRQVALSTPKIWSTIAIIDSKDGWNHTYSSLLKTQLQLSKSSLLTIAISCGGTVFSSSLMETLLPSSPRWETLRLTVGRLSPQFRAIEGKLPSLCNLFYDVPELFMSGGQPPIASIFKTAPKLRNLYVPGIDYLPCMLGFPFSQITNFSTTHGLFDCSSVLSYLKSFTALQQCSLLFSCSQSESDTLMPFILPNLRILKLVRVGSAGSAGDLARVLGKLTLPALEVLSINTVGDLETCLSPLLLRSKCILKELHFGNNVFVGIQDITIVFEESPSLERLTLHTGLCREIIAVLARRIDLLPSLQVLYFTRWSQQPDLYFLQFVKDARPGLHLVIQDIQVTRGVGS